MRQSKPLYEDQPDYEESPYRAVIISVYLIASLANGLASSTFAPLVIIVEKNFGTSKIVVSLNYFVFPICSAIFSPIVNWCLAKKGLRISYYIGSVVMITGIWLRTTLSESDPYLCLFGSILCGFSQLFIINSASKITLNWFRPEIMNSLTFLTALTMMISFSCSSFVPGLFLNEQSTSSDIISFFRAQAIIVTVPFVILCVFIRDKPETPPSKAASLEQEQKTTKNYIQTLKQLSKDKNYLKLAGSVALTMGTVVAMFGIIDVGLKGFGYLDPAKIISILVIIGLVFGVFGTFFYSFIVKKTKRYDWVSRIITFSLFIGYLLAFRLFLQGYQEIWQVSLLCVIFGLNYLSILPFFIVYASQIAFPVDQASITGYIIAIYHTFAFVLGLILVAVIKEEREVIIIIFSVLASLIFLGFLLTIFIKQDLRKDRYEEDLLKREDLDKCSDDGQKEGDDSERNSVKMNEITIPYQH